MEHNSEKDKNSAESQGLDQKTLEETLAPLGLKALLFIGATQAGDAFSMLEGTGADFITLLMVLTKEQPELVGMFLNTLVALASQQCSDFMQVGKEDKPAVMGSVSF